VYSFKSLSFQINKIQRKIKREVKIKKKIEIPSNPKENDKFNNSEPSEYVTTF